MQNILQDMQLKEIAPDKPELSSLFSINDIVFLTRVSIATL